MTYNEYCDTLTSDCRFRNDGPAPSFLNASDTLKGRISINWGELPDADRYTLFRDQKVLATDIQTNWYEDLDVETDREYVYEVMGLQGPCGSELSNPDTPSIEDAKPQKMAFNIDSLFESGKCQFSNKVLTPVFIKK